MSRIAINMPTAMAIKAKMRRLGMMSAWVSIAGSYSLEATFFPPARLSIDTTTDIPGRRSLSAATLAGTAMRTATRCVTLVKLPVALSGGSRLNLKDRDIGFGRGQAGLGGIQ